MRKKRPFTLLEVIVAMLLLGFLLTGMFQVFQQGLKKSVVAKELKQKILQLELFQLKMKNLFAHEKGVWLEKHADARGLALLTTFEEKADPEVERAGTLDGMLFLNEKKQLCFVSWSKKGKGRIEILLDKVDGIQFSLFDPKKKAWLEQWPEKKEEKPVMVKMDLEWEKQKLPFVFFLTSPSEHIIYSETT